MSFTKKVKTVICKKIYILGKVTLTLINESLITCQSTNSNNNKNIHVIIKFLQLTGFNFFVKDMATTII
jgi:hypothetical protein